MKIRLFFSDAQIPELKRLQASDRRLAKRKAMQHLKQSNPWAARVRLILSAVGAFVGWLLAPLIVAAIYPGNMRGISANLLLVYGIFPAVLACSGGLLGGFIGNQFLIARIRRYWRTGDGAERPE